VGKRQEFIVVANHMRINIISFVIIFCLLTIENRWFYVSLSVIGVIASVVACCISPYMVIIYNK
jgi:hypothetical protein